MEPKLCPVCSGSGKYADLMSKVPRECHGCAGKGWVTIGFQRSQRQRGETQ